MDASSHSPDIDLKQRECEAGSKLLEEEVKESERFDQRIQETINGAVSSDIFSEYE